LFVKVPDLQKLQLLIRMFELYAIQQQFLF